MHRTPCTQVRHLICLALSKLYQAADMLPLFSCVSGLQAYCQDKDKTMPEVGRAAGWDMGGAHEAAWE